MSFDKAFEDYEVEITAPDDEVTDPNFDATKILDQMISVELHNDLLHAHVSELRTKCKIVETANQELRAQNERITRLLFELRELNYHSAYTTATQQAVIHEVDSVLRKEKGE
jgi:regulator of replication initiation timing